jgi:hypothetical protein
MNRRFAQANSFMKTLFIAFGPKNDMITLPAPINKWTTTIEERGDVFADVGIYTATRIALIRKIRSYVIA